MKISELRKMNDQDLKKHLSELRKKTLDMRFSIANNQMSNLRDLRKAKKEIARILTIINDRKEVKN